MEGLGVQERQEYLHKLSTLKKKVNDASFEERGKNILIIADLSKVLKDLNYDDLLEEIELRVFEFSRNEYSTTWKKHRSRVRQVISNAIQRVELGTKINPQKIIPAPPLSEAMDATDKKQSNGWKTSTTILGILLPIVFTIGLYLKEGEVTRVEAQKDRLEEKIIELENHISDQVIYMEDLQVENQILMDSIKGRNEKLTSDGGPTN